MFMKFSNERYPSVLFYLLPILLLKYSFLYIFVGTSYFNVEEKPETFHFVNIFSWEISYFFLLSCGPLHHFVNTINASILHLFKWHDVEGTIFLVHVLIHILKLKETQISTYLTLHLDIIETLITSSGRFLRLFQYYNIMCSEGANFEVLAQPR